MNNKRKRKQVWKRATGVLKDQNSIWLATLCRRTAIRNPEIEAAVIKATSHDESHVDYRNAHRVFSWIRMSPTYFRPFAWALYTRMDRTRSWIVALKGLMLMHGVFCCKITAVQKIGRLPFDLSSFKDGHLSPAKSWGYNAFVRLYFSFLDQKSAFMCLELQETLKLGLRSNGETVEERPLLKEILRTQKLQGLMNMLLQIKPASKNMDLTLILEAMDCIIIEIFDVYSRICNGIAQVLLRIGEAGYVEAEMALVVLHKAKTQGNDLAAYFEFCREIGVINAWETPKVETIPEEDFRDLELIINGVSETNKYCSAAEEDEKKAIVVVENENHDHHQILKSGNLKTIITNKWEVFEEDLMKLDDDFQVIYSSNSGKSNFSGNPFADSFAYYHPPTHHYPHGNPQHYPDLISFL